MEKGIAQGQNICEHSELQLKLEVRHIAILGEGKCTNIVCDENYLIIDLLQLTSPSLLLQGEKTDCYVTLSGDLFHLSQEHLGSLSASQYEGKDKLCGLVTIIVTKAFDIPIPREDAATYVKVVYGEGTKHEKVFYTGTVCDYPGIDALNPMFDCVFHVPITSAMVRPDSAFSPRGSGFSSNSDRDEDIIENKFGGSSKQSSVASISSLRSSFASVAGNVTNKSKRVKKINNNITFTLTDADGANGTKGHGDLGKMTVTHAELLRAYKHTITETRPIGDGGAKLEFRAFLTGELQYFYSVSCSAVHPFLRISPLSHP